MNGSFRKILTATAASLLALTNVVSADYGWQDQQANGCCDTAYTRPCRPVCTPDCGNWWVDGEALFWKETQTGLGLGSEGEAETFDINGFTVAGEHHKVKRFNQDWNVGFRIGAGFNTPCDGWDVSGYWTHFNSTAKQHLSGTPGQLNPFYSLFTNNFLPFAPTYVSGHFKTDLNLFDIELGREYFLSQSLSFRPFIGVRGVWLQQKLNSNVYTPFNVPDIGSFTALEEIRMRNNFAGAGLRTGFDTEFALGCGLSLYGQGAIALLYGEQDVHYNTTFYVFSGTADVSDSGSSTQAASDGGIPTTRDKLKDNYCACRASYDLAVGLRWKYFFECDSSALTVSLGWEQHKFWGINNFEFLSTDFSDDGFGLDQTVRESTVIDRGDVCFQGITLAVRYDF